TSARSASSQPVPVSRSPNKFRHTYEHGPADITEGEALPCRPVLHGEEGRHLRCAGSRLPERPPEEEVDVVLAGSDRCARWSEPRGAAPTLHEAMPIYEYRCEQGHTFEVMQRMSDDPVVSCQTCSAPVERVFHPVAVHFKGSGFYNTDYGTR